MGRGTGFWLCEALHIHTKQKRDARSSGTKSCSINVTGAKMG